MARHTATTTRFMCTLTCLLCTGGLVSYPLPPHSCTHVQTHTCIHTHPHSVSAYVPLASWRRLAHRTSVSGSSHPACARLTWGGVKEFADGSLGAATALMWQPYAGGGSNTGQRLVTPAELARSIRGAARSGLQVAVHAIGDRAVDEVLDAFEAALVGDDSSSSSSKDSSSSSKDSSSSSKDSSSSSSSSHQLHSKRPPHRVEHAQHLSGPAAAARLLSPIHISEPT